MARKILLADDSVTAQNMGRKILADAGYEVIAVNNGSAALKKIAELKPELVILDVYMPGYSGLEVCQRLKESQETARIPVLLSVGKLEPFKPEEAQRVRADGYIVKPFEASELLSALSKLEDKVVPRAEPSKPGRFARAIAAAEESSRSSRTQASSEKAGDKNGWKSRIGFPHEKAESGKDVADDSSIYNSMKRDLRTVVETPGEKAAELAAKEARPQPAEEVPETSADVAALAPSGLPKDVTPEEVAAIAAAAAQIQMAGAAGKVEQQAGEPVSEINSGPGTEAGRAAAEANPPATPASQHDSDPVRQLAVAQESEIANPVAQATRESEFQPEIQRDHDGQSEGPQDVPVTMAASGESVPAYGGGSRWTAIPVALEGEEATISLEKEMQKAYAAFAAADAVEAASVPEVQEASAGDSAGPSEIPVPLAPSGEPERPAESEPAMSAQTIQNESLPVAPSETAVSSFEGGIPAGEVEAPVEASAETSPAPEVAEPQQPMPVAEFMSPVSEAEVAGLAGLVGLSAESQLAQTPEAEVETPKTFPASSKPFTRVAREEEAEQPGEESKPEAEAVKSTAAAWASWRQIRDTSKGSEGAAAPKEFDVSEAAPPETALAVAAGAEQIRQETSDATPNQNPADVASIVDSVLADLRPKLMAEISRKMAEKK